MAAYNQGWMIRCDDCSCNLSESISPSGIGATRKQIEAEARGKGWKVSRTVALCSECRKEREEPTP